MRHCAQKWSKFKASTTIIPIPSTIHKLDYLSEFLVIVEQQYVFGLCETNDFPSMMKSNLCGAHESALHVGTNEPIPSLTKDPSFLGLAQVSVDENRQATAQGHNPVIDQPARSPNIILSFIPNFGNHIRRYLY